MTDLDRRNDITRRLVKDHEQPERVALVKQLGAHPDDIRLGPIDRREMADRIVDWFQSRGRFEELERAVQEGVGRHRPLNPTVEEALHDYTETRAAAERSADGVIAIPRKEVEAQAALGKAAAREPAAAAPPPSALRSSPILPFLSPTPLTAARRLS